MKTSLDAIRTELLQQHADLRAKIADVLAAAEHWRKGDAGRDPVHGALGRLLAAVRAHNAREEELLRGIIPDIDAWGAVRKDIMDESHSREHEELTHALIAASTTADPDVAGGAIAALAERMRAHMEKEEKTFLGEEILRDEVGPVDSFGG